jgi:hypothetical protein
MSVMLTNDQVQWTRQFVGFSIDGRASAGHGATRVKELAIGASPAAPAAAPGGGGPGQAPDALDPATLDINPRRLSSGDGDSAWQDAAKPVTVQISPYGALTYLKIQGPDLNRLMAPLKASLATGAAWLPKLAAAVKTRDDAIAALTPWLNAPDQAANEVQAMAHQEAADEARTAEVAKSLENVIRQFGTNLQTQIGKIGGEISAAIKELESQRLFDKAAALKERAETISKVLEALKEAAKAGIEGAVKEGPEAGAAQAGLSLVKGLASHLAKMAIGDKLGDEIKALTDQAKTLHVSGVSEHLDAARNAYAELTTEINDVADGASIQSKVAARDKKIAVDRFDQQCDGDKACQSKFRFRLIDKAVDAVNQAMEAATMSYRGWSGAVVHIETFLERIEVMEYDFDGHPRSIDGGSGGYLRYDAAEGAGPRAMRAARARLKADSGPVTDAIHKDATQHESEALKSQQALQLQLIRLQMLHDKAFAALAATPGKMSVR